MYEKILTQDPKHSDSLHLLGMAFYQSGRQELAAEFVEKAIALNDTVAAYHSGLGAILQTQGRLLEAAAQYERSLEIDPNSAAAHINFGTVLHVLGRLEEATEHFERALSLKPDSPELLINFGNLLQAQGRKAEAAARYTTALALNPRSTEAHFNLALILHSQDKFSEAAAAYERALEITPGCVQAHYNLSHALRAQADWKGALSECRRTLVLQPDHAEARFSESLAQISEGDFSSGWSNYESRWKSLEHDTPMRDYLQPLWTGERLPTGRLLIWGEQGVGDEVMFAGLIPDVVRAGNSCILDCDSRLNALFTRSFPDVQVVSGYHSSQGGQLDIGAHLPAGSLPSFFRTTESAFSANTSPYLRSDPNRKQTFRDRYSDGRRLIGIAWHTKNKKTGRFRSVDLSLFRSLFDLSGVQWVSLQYGDHDALEAQVADADAPIIVDRSVDQLTDIDSFAAQIATLDLVVTIDNSTAHLAGALGVPTFVLLPFASDWRWLQKREDSPWYPTVRLFRQPSPGDWDSVVEKIRTVICTEALNSAPLATLV